jgi:sugar phosphate isomerase/epimerase
MQFSRRRFGSVAAGVLAGWAWSCRRVGEGEPGARKRIPIAVESWSVRELIGQDPEGVIGQIAEMGYEGIELAHYYRYENVTAERFRKALDAGKIRCCSVHLGLKNLEGDELARTVDYNRTLGNSVLIVASLPHHEAAAAWKETARRFDELAAKVGEYGMRLGYHNHPGDFLPVEGQIPWEVFFQNTSAKVIHQLDVANMPPENNDPVKYLKMFPGRTQSIHVKDRTADHKEAIVGEGVLPFREIFDLCTTIGGTEWYIVEYESDAYPPMESIRRCLEATRKLLEESS